MKSCCFAIAVSFLVISAHAQTNLNDLQAQVRSEYVRHEMVLRKGGEQRDLSFDDGGTPVAPLTPAPLVSGAALLITDAHLKRTEVRFDGVRLLLVGKKLEPLATNEKRTIRIEFRVPISSLEQVQAAMPHIFLTPPEFQQAIRSYYEPLLDLDAAKPGQQVGTWDSAPVYKVGADVSAPKAINAADPDYTKEARRQGYHGTTVLQVVVSADGLPAFMQVQKPLAYGLTEKALEAVARWRFIPAERAGRAVPVLISVEVNFRLY